MLEETGFGGLLNEGGRVRGVRLKTSDGRELRLSSTVTIDATGRQRVLARGSGRVEGKRARPKLVAFKAHLEGARGAAGACEIYFYGGGYGGLSPVEGGLSNLCFIARAADVRERGSDAGRVMREVLMRNARAAETLKSARAVTEWLGVSLESFGRHEPVPAEGLLAVGDAAAFIDPFTGSGMLMALESGELAASALAAWLPQTRRGGADELVVEEEAARGRVEVVGERVPVDVYRVDAPPRDARHLPEHGDDALVAEVVREERADGVVEGVVGEGEAEGVGAHGVDLFELA